ncbi:hypothetical protein NIES4101_74210 [Calothrix sp. NIES-4101]|nr:hypothetical protein NIES4101_74210 [Calothrix sp. NIES-4101]
MKCVFCNKNLRNVKRSFLGHCYECEINQKRRLHYTSKQMPSSATKEQVEAKAEELLLIRNDIQNQVAAMQNKIIKVLGDRTLDIDVSGVQ